MAITVLDAGVLIGLFDGDDIHHGRVRAALTESTLEEVVVPASAYAEVLVRPARRGSAAMRLVDDLLADLAAEVVPLTREIARAAAQLRAAHPTLRLPDALVLATGEVTDAGVVLTTDRRWLRYSRRARVV